MSLLKFFVIFIYFFMQVASAEQQILGVGDFKIGMSLDEFRELEIIKIGNYKFNEVLHSNYDAYDVHLYSIRATLGIPNVDGKDEHNLNISFYEGKLVSIYMLIHQIDIFKEILSAKYGTPRKKGKIGLVPCRYYFGGKGRALEGAEEFIWGGNKEISAKIHDSWTQLGCDTRHYVSFTIENSKSEQRMAEYIKKQKKQHDLNIAEESKRERDRIKASSKL